MISRRISEHFWTFRVGCREGNGAEQGWAASFDTKQSSQENLFVFLISMPQFDAHTVAGRNPAPVDR